MFGGIVKTVGEIGKATPAGQGLRVSVAARGLDLSDVKTGDSIAVNGVCLTVVGLKPGAFEAEVSKETLNCTSGFAKGDKVNLEKSLRLSDRVNGHLVSGHVDGVGKVAKFEREGECYFLAVKMPRGLAKYISRKGSIAVNGVSLTVNKAEGGEFTVNLIPHTLASTNLKYLKRGAKVNLEADLLARYAERLLQKQR